MKNKIIGNKIKRTKEEKFWQGDFGEAYRKRNDFNADQIDRHYLKIWGVKRSDMNKSFLNDLKINNILEVGCNTGNQLQLLEKQGHKNLSGTEINANVVKIAQQILPNTKIIDGSIFDLPYGDNSFDLVFTSGVLIHINPNDISSALKQIYRTAKKYIWGFEYYSEEYKNITYRGHKNKLWKTDFCKLYLDSFPDLKLVKKKFYPYIANKNVDIMFLLEK